MTSAETYGSRFSKAVREYLESNGLKSLGQINERMLAMIAQEFHDKDRAVAKTRLRMAREEEWLKTVEADPAMAGIDVRRELGKCEFWCKGAQVVPTRARFIKWLLKCDRDKPISGHYDGATSRPKPQQVKRTYTVDIIVPGWAMLLRTVPELNFTDAEIDAYCAQEWEELPVPVREKIIKVA